MAQNELKKLALEAEFISKESDRILRLLKESCDNLKSIYEKSGLPSDLKRYEEAYEQYKNEQQHLQETKKRLADFVKSIE